MASIALPVINHVVVTDENLPVVGFFAVDKSWRYDFKTWATEMVPGTQYLTRLIPQSTGLLEQVPISFWSSGVNQGLKLLHQEELRAPVDKSQTPVYKTGRYSTFWSDRKLFSDYSRVQPISLIENVGGRNFLALDTDARTNTLEIAIWKREADYAILPALVVDQVSNFTGVLSGNSRIIVGDPIDWNDVSDRHPEAMVNEDLELLFNKSYEIPVGKGVLDADVKTYWEAHGRHREGRVLFTEYFSLDLDSVEIVGFSPTDVRSNWIRKETLAFSLPTDRHYVVDAANGIIYTSGWKPEDRTLAFGLTMFSDVVVLKPQLTDYLLPNKGWVTIGTERILYQERSGNELRGCIRGHGTAVAIHVQGEEVIFHRQGALTNDNLFVKYVAVPRVEYEVTSSESRTANTVSGFLDLKPVSNSESNNIVQISPTDLNLARIELTCDRDLIGGNLFGPIYFGTDTARLKATAYSSSGNYVDDLPIGIQVVYGPGSLNSGSQIVHGVSNNLGSIYAFYNAPLNNHDINYQVNSVTHVGSDTEVELANIPLGLSAEEFWLFQIMKHDHHLGTVGDKVRIMDGDIAPPPYGFGYIDVAAGDDLEKYVGGIVRILHTDFVIRQYRINQVLPLPDPLEGLSRFYLADSVNNALINPGVTEGWLFAQDSILWNPSTLNGTRVILYEWDMGSEHPITQVVGAWSPVRPDSISGNTLVYANKLLPIPDAIDDEVNLGGYIVVAPSEAKIRAFARDPYTGNLILSNEIRFKVLLSPSLIGVNDEGLLPIPHGLKLITEEYNLGSGIGGANFLTVNPAASGINQFSIGGVI